VIIADIEYEAVLGISACVLDRLEVSARKLSHLASPVSDLLKKLDRVNIFMIACEKLLQGGWYGA